MGLYYYKNLDRNFQENFYAMYVSDLCYKI